MSPQLYGSVPGYKSHQSLANEKRWVPVCSISLSHRSFFLSPADKPHAPSPAKPHVKPRASSESPGSILKSKTQQHLLLTLGWSYKLGLKHFPQMTKAGWGPHGQPGVTVA